MGYSCTRNAGDRLDMILKADNSDPSSNMWVKEDGYRYFFERGRENSDGAITGTVYQIRGEYAYRKGTAKIDPDGKVTRFPHMNSVMRKASKEPLPSIMDVGIFSFR